MYVYTHTHVDKYISIQRYIYIYTHTHTVYTLYLCNPQFHCMFMLRVANFPSKLQDVIPFSQVFFQQLAETGHRDSVKMAAAATAGYNNLGGKNELMTSLTKPAQFGLLCNLGCTARVGRVPWISWSTKWNLQSVRKNSISNLHFTKPLEQCLKVCVIPAIKHLAIFTQWIIIALQNLSNQESTTLLWTHWLVTYWVPLLNPGTNFYTLSDHFFQKFCLTPGSGGWCQIHDEWRRCHWSAKVLIRFIGFGTIYLPAQPLY